MNRAFGALVVGGVLRRDDRVLLVQEPMADGELRWGLPGGKVEPDELLHEALVREVLEETGLAVTQIGPIAYMSHHYHPDHVSPTGGGLVAVTFEVPAFEGEPAPDDPDGIVVDARFVTVPTALDLIKQGPQVPATAPLVSYLAGHSDSGSSWFWRFGESTTEPVAVHPDPT